MAFAPIKKDAIGIKVSPNFTDYERTCAEFSWTASERELSKFPAARGLNIAFECVDRHAQGLRRDHLALRWLGKQGEVRDFTYGDLQRLSNRFATVLRALGIGKGDRVFALAGQVPELYVTALGTLKNGSVFCPLFSAFGPEPIQIDVDSVDFLNFVIGLHKALGVEIPDADVAKLATLNGCARYLVSKTGKLSSVVKGVLYGYDKENSGADGFFRPFGHRRTLRVPVGQRIWRGACRDQHRDTG